MLQLDAIFRLLLSWRLDRSLTGIQLEGQLELILKLEAIFDSYQAGGKYKQE